MVAIAPRRGIHHANKIPEFNNGDAARAIGKAG